MSSLSRLKLNNGQDISHQHTTESIIAGPSVLQIAQLYSHHTANCLTLAMAGTKLHEIFRLGLICVQGCNLAVTSCLLHHLAFQKLRCLASHGGLEQLHLNTKLKLYRLSKPFGGKGFGMIHVAIYAATVMMDGAGYTQLVCMAMEGRGQSSDQP